jgi:hypothetical protein
MRAVVLLFACLTCVGHARRVRAEDEEGGNSQAFAKLLSAFAPASQAAFNPSILGSRTPLANSARASSARMMWPEDLPPKDIMSMLPDIKGPALYDMDYETRKMTLREHDDVNLFTQELQKSPVGELLKGGGPYTLFIPVNSAVEAFLGSGGVFTEDILKNHIAQGTFNFQEFKKEPTLNMLNGKTVKAEPSAFGNEVEINGVEVPGFFNPAGTKDTAFPYDLACTNGVVFGTRGVLVLP